MVATFLQDELVEELKGILKGFLLKNPQGEKTSINIFKQLLPMPEPLDQEEIAPELLENGLAEEQTAPDPYPYIIVRTEDGKIEDENSAQIVNLTLLIGVFDPAYDKQGHKDILNIIARLTIPK